MNEIKKLINHTMFTTGVSLVILAVFSVILKIKMPYGSVVLQIFLANVVIHLGLFLLIKLEIRNLIIGFIIDLSCIFFVLFMAGFLFDWFSVIPMWSLAIMAFITYILTIIIFVRKLKQDTAELNELLKKHKEKQADNAS